MKSYDKIRIGVIIMLMSIGLCSCSLLSPYRGLRPSDYSKKEVKNEIIKFYKEWNDTYIRKDDTSGGKYVYWKADSVNRDNTATVSEAHGFGMLILVNMANIDNKNSDIYKEDYDDFIRFYNRHRSSIINEFMCWQMIFSDDGEIINIDNASSATDGDIDIAYSLILADELWGSDGEFDYISMAGEIIKAFRINMVSEGKYIFVGDSILKYSKHSDLIRSSDFILDALYKFKEIDKDNEDVWDGIIEEIGNILNAITTDYSENTGLIPDFILSTPKGYTPALGKKLETENDGDFGYNACRTPYRIGSFSLYDKDDQYDYYLKAYSKWTKETTKINPGKLNAGYYIINGPVGTPLPNSDYESLAFIAPLLISASLDKDQDWYDAIYEYIVNRDIKDDGYYGNTLKMLVLIVGTGNKIY
jgi:endo-1,4-beta-D-glucanase Y